MKETALQTQRLCLRGWREQDVVEFSEMNQDSEVMQYFPRQFTPEESRASVEQLEAHRRSFGFTYWAVEELTSGRFIGFIGLKVQLMAGRTPFLDVGWRLKKETWRRGYATEGARASLAFAFDQLGAPEVLSVAPELNVPSIRVMEKLGLRQRQVFEHPSIPSTSPLRACTLHAISREDWLAAQAAN